MTLHVADIASYQGKLTLAQLRVAGFDGINVKVSHGLGQKSVHPEVDAYVRQARAGGWALSSFHFLDASASGIAQAQYAYGRIQALGLDVNAVHVVDCEADATQQQYLDYCAVMARLLGRDIATYSGRWWWEPRGWTPSPFSPWLWSAPAAGYLPSYPGDASEHWKGYGGWPELAVMQYRVAAVNGIKVSQSAVRSQQLWRQMTGEDMSAWTVVPCLLQLRSEFNELAPKRDKGADGTIGDTAHSSSSDHTPDEDSNVLRDHDADSKNEVHALDIDSTGPWPRPFAQLVADVITPERVKWKSETDKCRLEYVIFNRKIYSRERDFQPVDYTGSDPHTNHAHFSARYLTATEQDTRPFLATAQPSKPEEQEDIVEAKDIDAIAKAVWDHALAAPAGSNDPDGKWMARSYMTNIYPATVSARTYAAEARGIVPLVKEMAARGDVDVTALAGALAAPLANALAPLLEDKDVTTETVLDALRQALND